MPSNQLRSVFTLLLFLAGHSSALRNVGEETVLSPSLSDFDHLLRRHNARRQLYYSDQNTIRGWGRYEIILTSTTTSSTTYGIVTCTKSTTVCAGRRRRTVLSNVNESQFLEDIAPSPITKIETTAVAATEYADPTRKARTAEPQYFLEQHPSFYAPSYRASTDGSQELNISPSVDEFVPRGRPIDHMSSLLRNMMGSSKLPRVDNNQFGGRQAPSVRRRITVTLTATQCILSIITSTSVPVCSVSSGFAQCPPVG